MDSDCLEILSTDYLKLLLNYVKLTLGESTIWAQNYLYHHLKMTEGHFKEKCENISDACLTKIYGPISKEFKNCTFIGMTGLKNYSLFLFTVEENAYELIECFKKTKKIRWELKTFFIYMQKSYSNQIDTILDSKGFFKKKYHIEDVYYLPKEIAKDFTISIPQDIFPRSLKLEDAKLINDNWPYKDDKSLQLIESLIQINGGITLYNADTNELIAWILINAFNCPGFLYTIKNERHKGNGSTILKMQCKQIAADNNQTDICVVVARENNASKAMITKLGFKYIEEIICIDLL